MNTINKKDVLAEIKIALKKYQSINKTERVMEKSIVGLPLLEEEEFKADDKLIAQVYYSSRNDYDKVEQQNKVIYNDVELFFNDTRQAVFQDADIVKKRFFIQKNVSVGELAKDIFGLIESRVKENERNRAKEKFSINR